MAYGQPLGKSPAALWPGVTTPVYTGAISTSPSCHPSFPSLHSSFASWGWGVPKVNSPNLNSPAERILLAENVRIYICSGSIIRSVLSYNVD